MRNAVRRPRVRDAALAGRISWIDRPDGVGTSHAATSTSAQEIKSVTTKVLWLHDAHARGAARPSPGNRGTGVGTGD